MYHILFICSSVDEHLSFFHVWAIVNSAAMNHGVCVSFLIVVFYRYMPRCRIAGLYSSSIFLFFSSVQLFGCAQLFATPWRKAMTLGFLSVTNSWSLLKLMSIDSVRPSNHLILCCPLFLPPSILPTIRVFSFGSVLCIRWPKYRSFSFSISPSNEYLGLISFRIDWLDLLAVQRTIKSFCNTTVQEY